MNNDLSIINNLTSQIPDLLIETLTRFTPNSALSLNTRATAFCLLKLHLCFCATSMTAEAIPSGGQSVVFLVLQAITNTL